jgi:hypothetical protein
MLSANPKSAITSALRKLDVMAFQENTDGQEGLGRPLGMVPTIAKPYLYTEIKGGK